MPLTKQRHEKGTHAGNLCPQALTRSKFPNRRRHKAAVEASETTCEDLQICKGPACYIEQSSDDCVAS